MANKLTTEEFIRRAQDVHGERYGYSLVDYASAHSRVKIVCSKHGVFEQLAYSHLNGSGCRQCSQRMPMNTESFRECARKVHGDKFGYSLVKYKNNKTKVTIICPDHGQFQQLPKEHLKGSKCAACSGVIPVTFEEFVKRSRKIHGGKYDYSLANIQGIDKKVKIVCPTHGTFKQTPYSHYNGSGCPACRKTSTEEFVNRARIKHGTRYDYSMCNYVNAQTKVKIICRKHGPFETFPNNHLNGNCPRCGKNAKPTTEKFIAMAREVHGDRYDYSQANYIRQKCKLKIVCPEHGLFLQRPDIHLKGSGCPKCAFAVIGNKTSQRFKKVFSTQKFIKRARRVHGNKFDYSKTEYIDLNHKVVIGCPIHGFSEQDPKTHLTSLGCRKCGIDSRKRKRSKGRYKFIQDAIGVHGDKYDYSQVQYVNSHTYVTVVCPEHGPWQAIPSNHITNTAGCPRCGGTGKYDTQSFIAQARSVHHEKYDYSLVNYESAHIPVTIICPNHGEFQQKPGQHLFGQGCPRCGDKVSADKRRHTTDQFIVDTTEVHGDKYDYSKVKYSDKKTKVEIVCPQHGVFWQSPDHHKMGGGCPECWSDRRGDHSRMTKDEFIEKARAIHGDKYDYNKVIYRNNRTKVSIVCPDHGEFEQSPDAHIYQASGCRACAPSGYNTSKPGILYYIRINTFNQTLYKIGITNNSVEQRYLKGDLDKITVLKTARFEDGRDALDAETSIMRRFKNDRYTGAPVLTRVGTSEMFNRDVLGLDNNLDNWEYVPNAEIS